MQGEEHLKQLAFFFCHIEKTGIKGDLETATKAVLSTMLSLKTLLNVPKYKKQNAKALRLIEVKAAKDRLVVAEAVESTHTCLSFDFFRKLLVNDPEVQWDRIVTNMHTENPWTTIMVKSTTASAGNPSCP